MNEALGFNYPLDPVVFLAGCAILLVVLVVAFKPLKRRSK